MRVKLGAYTPKAIVVVADRLPEVPVMVRLYCPTRALLLAASVNMVFEVVGFVLHIAVTPLGNDDVTARLTLPLNPYAGVT